MGNSSSKNGLRPIDLGGGVQIDTPVILAPMSGVTDLPFRRTAKSLGAGMVVSEMIASWAMLRENQKTLSMAQVDGAGGISAVQLAGCEPAAMAEAARIAADRGADLRALDRARSAIPLRVDGSAWRDLRGSRLRAVPGRRTFSSSRRR